MDPDETIAPPAPRAPASAGPVAGCTVVVLQPGYLPWLGFFDQVRRTDIFIYYDDVQFDKHGWRNRNRVKSPAGLPHWLTVPVLHHGLGAPHINEVLIDSRQPWARKHLSTLQQFYARAPFTRRYLAELADLFGQRWERLIDLDVALVARLCDWLGVSARFEFASTLNIGGGQSERLLNLCRHFGAGRYLSGDAARDYLDIDLFRRHGIEVEWQQFHHPIYPQQHGDFVGHLSAIDLLLNCGPDAAAILAGAGPARQAG